MREFLAGLLEANIAAAIAVAFVLALRGEVRRRWGAHAAYLMWAVIPAAMLATLVPARTVIVQAPAASPAFEAPPAAAVPGAMGMDWLATAFAALPWLWLAGLAATGAWLLLGQARFLGDVRRGKAGPAVVGLLRPHIVIPSDFGGRFAAREQELILAHEHVHLARHDARLNTLVALARCVCWFNPMIHVGAHAMRIDQELSCDAAVVGRRPGARRAYAEALLKTQLAARPLPLGCYWPAGTQHPLTERIAMLTRNSPSRRTRLLASAGVVLIAAGAGLAAWAAQPEHVVIQEAPQPAPLTDQQRAQEWLDRRVTQLREEAQASPNEPARTAARTLETPSPAFEQSPPPAPRAPQAPAAPTREPPAPTPPAPETPEAAPTPKFFALAPAAPETPEAAPRFFAAPQPPDAPRFFAAPIPTPGARVAPAPPPLETPAPLAAPAAPLAPRVAPAPAPQELPQAERDALLRQIEARQREMEERLLQIERQRGELELERKLLEVERQKLRSGAPRPTGDLQFDLPKMTLDPAAAKKMLEDTYRYKEADARAPALGEFVIRKPDGTVRNKLVLGQVDKSFPFDSEIERARAAAEKRKREQAERQKQTGQPE